MMAKDAAQRYQTPREVADALKGFLAAEPEPLKEGSGSVEVPQYIDWLKQQEAAKATPAAKIAAIPAAAPATPAAKVAAPAPAAALAEPQLFPLPKHGTKLVPSNKPLPSAQKVLRQKRREMARRRKSRPPRRAGQPAPAGTPAAVTPPAPEIDVEPVGLHDLVKAPLGLPINRDLFMVLVGALSVLAVAGVVWLVVWLDSGSTG
jgi:hypothetical protein